MSNFVNLLDIVYPIGSIYITFSDVSPADSVGGTWEKIEDKFLQSSGETNTLNSVGGYSNSIELSLQYASWYYNLATLANAATDAALLFFNGNAPAVNNTESIRTSQWGHDTNSSTGTGIKIVQNPKIITKKVSWDNRPSYITCNMYRRIA